MGTTATRLLAASLLLSLTLPFSSTSADTTDTDSAESVALDFVESIGAGNNLMGIALQVAPTTQTFAALVAETDQQTAQALLQRELEAARPGYQHQWNVNLADAYLEHMKPDELQSVAESKRESEYFEKLIGNQDKIGASMQDLSKSLLGEFVSKALSSALLAAESDGETSGAAPGKTGN